MIIDIHQHVVAGPEPGAYHSGLLNSRGFHGKGNHGVTPENIAKVRRRGKTHSELLDEVGTDVGFLSPRPYTMMHSEKPEKIVHWYCEATNDAIAAAIQNEPERFAGVAGLPQSVGVSPTNTFEEIDRCINDLGFIGVMINPDPGEGDYSTPGMGEEYWYPLYEKMVQMNIPGLIHGAACKNPRESFHNHFITEESIAVLSLIDSTVFDDFPDLKLIISHGGGSIPYQVGRWRSQLRGPNDTENFDDRMRSMYYDTGLYNQESLELLFKVVGPDRCMFGTERPGAGSKTDPRTGRWYDDLKPMIDAIEWLDDEGRELIYEGNVPEVFPRYNAR